MPLVFALFLADVIAKMADVIVMWLVLLPLFYFVCFLTDVIAFVADVVATIVVMFGRCYCLETDGIAYCGHGW